MAEYDSVPVITFTIIHHMLVMVAFPAGKCSGFNAVLMASNYCLLNNGTEKVSIVTDVFLPFYEMKPAVFFYRKWQHLHRA